MDYYQMLQKDTETYAPRPDIRLTLTDEQYRRLLKKAYETGLNSPSELLAHFVADLTGCQRNGSDEEDLANDWCRRAFGEAMEASYFRMFLAETYPYVEDYQEMLEDPNYFSDIYQEYIDYSFGLDYQTEEDCRALLTQLIREDEASYFAEKSEVTPNEKICSQKMYDSMNLTQRHILKDGVLQAFFPGADLRVSIHSPTALRVSDPTDEIIMFSESPDAPVYDDYHFPSLMNPTERQPTLPALEQALQHARKTAERANGQSVAEAELKKQEPNHNFERN